MLLNFSSDSDQTHVGRKDLEARLVHPIVQKAGILHSLEVLSPHIKQLFFLQMANFPKKSSHLQIPIDQFIKFKFQYFIAIFHISELAMLSNTKKSPLYYMQVKNFNWW